MSWIITIIAVLYALAIARRLVEAEAELRAERRLRWQAEIREEHSNRTRRRTTQINHELALKRPMYFAGMPTWDATAYKMEKWSVITYDN